MENAHIPDVQNMPKGLIFHKMDYKFAKKYTKPPFKQKNGIPRSFNQNPVSILAKKSQIQAMFFIFSEFTRTNPKLLHMMIQGGNKYVGYYFESKRITFQNT